LIVLEHATQISVHNDIDKKRNLSKKETKIKIYRIEQHPLYALLNTI